MVSQGADVEWSSLVESTDEARESAMRERYTEIAALDEDARKERLKAMAEAEYALPDDKLRVFSLSRLRTWLSLPDDVALAVAHSYDAVMQRMPGPVAMRRVSIVQTLTAEFSTEDEDRLRALVPGVFAGMPSHTRVVADVPDPAAAPPAKKKSLFNFWRK
jgi:hypothetical protein